MAGAPGRLRGPGVADDRPPREPAGAPSRAAAHREPEPNSFAIAPGTVAQGSQAIQPPARERTAADHVPQRPTGTGTGAEGSWTLSAPPSADSATRPGAGPGTCPIATAAGESPAVRPAGAHHLRVGADSAT